MPSPHFFDSDWDYQDYLQGAIEKYKDSEPLSEEIEEREKDLNAEVKQKDAEY